MPKEIVYDQAAMYDAAVQWEQNRYVQVGVVTHDGATLASRLTGEHIDAEEAAQFIGVWGTLDREGCNRMIRALRRARDQAFGRDE